MLNCNFTGSKASNLQDTLDNTLTEYSPGFLGRRVWAEATIRFLAIQSVYGYVYFQDMNTSIYIYVIINFWTSSKTKMQFWGIKSNGAHWILVEKAHSAQGDDFLEAWNGETKKQNMQFVCIQIYRRLYICNHMYIFLYQLFLHIYIMNCIIIYIYISI